MTSAWSRRGFLAATGGSALTAGLARPAAAAPRGAAAATAADDAFAALRATWRTLTLGEGYSPTAEPSRTKRHPRQPGRLLPQRHGTGASGPTTAPTRRTPRTRTS
ncbi:hypothetical protein [Streptomyces sp. NPDC007988]|uniref:hypothetical protein n=1 Tax=Streptomyces sp. NPDC007988 TaxID=3364802 RepID=UPI0036E692E0